MELTAHQSPYDDSEGCRQDINWTGGFASFQSYTVGSVLTAQPDAALRRDLDQDVDEFVEAATGNHRTADDVIEYAEEKFGELYGI